jgi:gag-pre-integrase-like protein
MEKLILYNKDREIIAIGIKINQNLYKFSFESAIDNTSSKYTYVMTNQPSQSWEIWHRCFGHMGYTGLKILHDRNLVEGFDVDTLSKIKDCTACIQAKSSVQPYKGHHIQWLKKLSQCLATLERLACHKSNKIDNNLKLIYVILHYLGFRISPRSCDLDKN